MYRQVLAELAHARGWEVHCYDAKHVEAQAADMLGERADEVLRAPGQRSARPGRRTTGSHSPRRSWPATDVDRARGSATAGLRTASGCLCPGRAMGVDVIVSQRSRVIRLGAAVAGVGAVAAVETIHAGFA